MKNRIIAVILLLSCALVLMTGCKKEQIFDTGTDYHTPPVKFPVEVDSLALDKTLASLAVGESITLEVSIFPTNATECEIVWSSSNPKVATVDNGTVCALSKGTTAISVTSENGKRAACVITVTE